MIRKVLRHVEERRATIHLWVADQRAACGREFVTVTGAWMDDDQKLTCPECCAIRDSVNLEGN